MFENYLLISKITPQTLDQYWSSTCSFSLAHKTPWAKIKLFKFGFEHNWGWVYIWKFINLTMENRLVPSFARGFDVMQCCDVPFIVIHRVSEFLFFSLRTPPPLFRRCRSSAARGGRPRSWRTPSCRMLKWSWYLDFLSIDILSYAIPSLLALWLMWSS